MQQSYFDQSGKQDKNTEFSGLLVIQKDMKDIFRKLIRMDAKFKISLQNSHTRFFNKFYKHKRAILLEGSAASTSGNEIKSAFAEQIASKAKAKGQILDQFMSQRKNTSEYSSSKQMRDRAQSAPMSPMKGVRRQAGSEVYKEEIELTAGRKLNCQEENFFGVGNSNSVMLNAMLQTLREEIKAQTDEKKPEPSQIQTEAQQQFELRQKNLDLLLKGDVSTQLKQFEFTKILSNQILLDELIHKIYESDPKRIRDMLHLRYSLQYCDKNLYQKFRDYQISYDQFLARVEEQRFGTKYVVLDDMVGTVLEPRFLDPPKDLQLYKQYMEILQEEQERDKRPKTAAAEKESFNHPVGVKCVRSLYSNANQKKASMFANRSVEQVMRENHIREVNERRQVHQDQHDQKLYETTQRSQIRSQHFARIKSMRQKSRFKSALHSKRNSNGGNGTLKAKQYEERLRLDLNQMVPVDDYKTAQPRSPRSKRMAPKSAKTEKKNNQKSLIQQKREDENLKRSEQIQQTLFINRLQDDGANIITDKRDQLFETLAGSFAEKIDNVIKQNRIEEIKQMVQPIPKSVKMHDNKESRKIAQSQMSSPNNKQVGKTELIKNVLKNSSVKKEPYQPIKLSHSQIKTISHYQIDPYSQKRKLHLFENNNEAQPNVESNSIQMSPQIKKQAINSAERSSSVAKGFKYRIMQSSLANHSIDEDFEEKKSVSKNFLEWYNSAIGGKSTQQTVSEWSYKRRPKNPANISAYASPNQKTQFRGLSRVQSDADQDNMSNFGSLSISQQSTLYDGRSNLRSASGLIAPHPNQHSLQQQQIDYKTKAIVQRLQSQNQKQQVVSDFKPTVANMFAQPQYLQQSKIPTPQLLSNLIQSQKANLKQSLRFSPSKSREGSIESSKYSLINSDIAMLKSSFTKLKAKMSSAAIEAGTGVEEIPKFEASSIANDDLDYNNEATAQIDELDLSQLIK